jgi:hypothetical protein
MLWRLKDLFPRAAAAVALSMAAGHAPQWLPISHMDIEWDGDQMDRPERFIHPAWVTREWVNSTDRVQWREDPTLVSLLELATQCQWEGSDDSVYPPERYEASVMEAARVFLKERGIVFESQFAAWETYVLKYAPDGQERQIWSRIRCVLRACLSPDDLRASRVIVKASDAKAMRVLWSSCE